MSYAVFLLSLASGAACGLLEGLLSPLRRRAGTVFTVITDFAIGSAVAILYAAISYALADGTAYAYAAVAEAAAFITVRTVASKLAHRAARHLPAPKNTAAERQRRSAPRATARK